MRSPLYCDSRPAAVDATDDVASESSEVRSYECDRCGASFDGEPGGAGLFVWHRGEEVRFEEPPLCEECAKTVTMLAFACCLVEEEEG
jgi:hypothetical protein